MQVQSLQNFFASSPAVRLLRSPHAFWIMDFLRQQFKDVGQITRPHSELAVELDNYLDHLGRAKVLDGKLDSREKADTYLSSWCSGSIGWLKRFVDEQAVEPHYQLTAEFEKALAFVDRASRDVGFVGTESRLRSILELLDSVVAGASEDPQQRLKQLQLQRAEIDREIASLQASPGTVRMSGTQLRERFELAFQQLQQLKSEFRSVEDRFKEITRAVQQRILAAADSRGDILQYALDSEDMLKQGDQGQSFSEFLKLLYAPESQERISSLIEQLNAIDELAAETEGVQAVRDMVPTLVAEAEKILRTTQHLSVTLRRLLDSKATRHHQQLASVLRDILGAAAHRAEQPPADLGMDIEVELEIQSGWERPFWVATEPFEEVELQPVETDDADKQLALDQLVSLERLDWQALRQNIARAMEQHGEISLVDLLHSRPLTSGVVELLGYLQIAFDDGHAIDRTQQMRLPAEVTGELQRELRVPHVRFLSSERQQAQPEEHGSQDALVGGTDPSPLGVNSKRTEKRI